MWGAALEFRTLVGVHSRLAGAQVHEANGLSGEGGVEGSQVFPKFLLHYFSAFHIKENDCATTVSD